jgi:hypothetical protein
MRVPFAPLHAELEREPPPIWMPAPRLIDDRPVRDIAASWNRDTVVGHTGRRGA